jgi:uncharacterized membrane protein
VLIGVPIAAWMLSISFLQAFMLEIGFFLFFLPYTMLYNWGVRHAASALVRGAPAGEFRVRNKPSYPP